MELRTILAQTFHIRPEQVDAVIELLDGGNTVPFIARYRKEATGSLDDQLLRELSDKLDYLRNLQKRREEISKSLQDQGVLTEEITAALNNAATLAELEDLYRPFRPKRRTRAMIAKENGLEPLALWLMMQYPRGDVAEQTAKYVKEGLGAEDCLAGARDILAESVSDDAALRKRLRAFLMAEGLIHTEAAGEEDSVYSMYYGYQEQAGKMAAHRVLAVNRGEKENFLKVSLQIDQERAMGLLKNTYVKNASPSAEQVTLACADAWKRLLFPSLENEIRTELTDRANEQSIRVFSENLRNLLMQPPIKGKVTLGVDPGFRTGCKLAVVDETGKVLETGVGQFTLPGMERAKKESAEKIKRMCKQWGVTAIAIGNGTASRESEQFIVSLLPELGGARYMIVSEAGASVYSASKLAAQEFPEYDVSLRSAVSIARRMQDPLAELVKIEPRAIGVGQYQHDLKQNELETALDGVVEQCVNKVGVELSTASVQLLEHVSGIGPALAKNIVAYREENGIPTRAALKKVPKLGPHAFEQCAGFLRIAGSANPLDATGVHPESYAVTKELLKVLNVKAEEIKKGGVANIRALAEEYGLEKLCGELDCGLPTLQDILQELAKPGRDPREDLPAPVLRSDVLDMKDLKPGMELTGTVRNVVDFGAFVDIGVHRDGLVHITQIVNRYIRHPSEVLSVGDVVKVWVVDVDEKKNRISLTMLNNKK